MPERQVGQRFFGRSSTVDIFGTLTILGKISYRFPNIWINCKLCYFIPPYSFWNAPDLTISNKSVIIFPRQDQAPRLSVRRKCARRSTVSEGTRNRYGPAGTGAGIHNRWRSSNRLPEGMTSKGSCCRRAAVGRGLVFRSFFVAICRRLSNNFDKFYLHFLNYE